MKKCFSYSRRSIYILLVQGILAGVASLSQLFYYDNRVGASLWGAVAIVSLIGALGRLLKMRSEGDGDTR